MDDLEIALHGTWVRPNPIKRWAVISLKDHGSGSRQGYAYLYPEKPDHLDRVSGIGSHVFACIEIEFAEGEGLPPQRTGK